MGLFVLVAERKAADFRKDVAKLQTLAELLCDILRGVG